MARVKGSTKCYPPHAAKQRLKNPIEQMEVALQRNQKLVARVATLPILIPTNHLMLLLQPDPKKITHLRFFAPQPKLPAGPRRVRG